MNLKKLFAAAALLLAPALAFAHPGHGDNGLVAGISHPLGGLDHLLAMVAVGLWAAQQKGNARWALPCAFVGTMLIGGMLGFEGLHLPALESGIAASVLALGLAVALAVRPPLFVAVGATALFACVSCLRLQRRWCGWRGQLRRRLGCGCWRADLRRAEGLIGGKPPPTFDRISKLERG
ncbi:MAG: protein hupE [Pseudomonas orientalis]|nr:protein hupE [Pseudomonas orientalis]